MRRDRSLQRTMGRLPRLLPRFHAACRANSRTPVGGDSALEAFGRRQHLGHLPRRRLESNGAQLAGCRRGLDRKPGQPVEHRRGEPGERRRAVVAVEERAAVFRIGHAADEAPARAPMPRPEQARPDASHWRCSSGRGGHAPRSRCARSGRPRRARRRRSRTAPAAQAASPPGTRPHPRSRRRYRTRNAGDAPPASGRRGARSRCR